MRSGSTPLTVSCANTRMVSVKVGNSSVLSSQRA